jgi:hypothetical protein
MVQTCLIVKWSHFLFQTKKSGFLMVGPFEIRSGFQMLNHLRLFYYLEFVSLYLFETFENPTPKSLVQSTSENRTVFNSCPIVEWFRFSNGIRKPDK